MASRAVKAPLKKRAQNKTVDEYSDVRGIESSVEYSNPHGARSMEPTNRGYPSRQMQIQQIQQKQMDVLEMVEAQKLRDKKKMAQAGGQLSGNNSTVGNPQFGRGERGDYSEERRPMIMMSNLKVPHAQKLNVRIMKRDHVNTGLESMEQSVEEGELDSPGLSTAMYGMRARADSKAATKYMQNENSQGSYGEFGGDGYPRVTEATTPLKKVFRVKKLSSSPQHLNSLQANHARGD